MSIVKFTMSDVERLISELESCQGFTPTGDDIWTDGLYVGGKVVDKDGRTQNDPDFSWPDSSKIDRTKLTPQLIMVKDQGLYLLNNAKMTGSASERGKVVYAAGCNPDTDDFWYENAKDAFGGDDGTIAFPADWYHCAKKANKRVFAISITTKSIRLKL